jgi:hypothetical protein
VAPPLCFFDFNLKWQVMKLGEFNALSLNNQVKAVFNKGAYVADRLEQEFTVVLYKVGRFCVEIYYHEADSEPVNLRSFVSIDRLKPYFKEANVSCIV